MRQFIYQIKAYIFDRSEQLNSIQLCVCRLTYTPILLLCRFACSFAISVCAILAMMKLKAILNVWVNCGHVWIALASLAIENKLRFTLAHFSLALALSLYLALALFSRKRFRMNVFTCNSIAVLAAVNALHVIYTH